MKRIVKRYTDHWDSIISFLNQLVTDDIGEIWTSGERIYVTFYNIGNYQIIVNTEIYVSTFDENQVVHTFYTLSSFKRWLTELMIDIRGGVFDA